MFFGNFICLVLIRRSFGKNPVEDGSSEAITLILCHMCCASSAGNIYFTTILSPYAVVRYLVEKFP
jgi:hypothetical protein